MDKVIGEFAVPLETRFSEVRTKETNMGKYFSSFSYFSAIFDLSFQLFSTDIHNTDKLSR